ncbi:restriction endonuclease [Cohnella sp. GbtcB17]|uniref:restriction endonuclease n=1 Tax=Cohnella sp. GbtcB17 TaxID=2824762 RepID=UPI0034D5FC52
MKEYAWFAWLIVIPIAMGIISGLMQPAKKKRSGNRRKRPTKTVNKKTTTLPSRTSKSCRSDEVLLTSALDQLNGVEFERLLALYFRGQGYQVHEVGVGGNDGGVDLVVVDKRGERTAVQAKCYADHNFVPVQTVRELVAAKRNHNCILSLLITTSDLTKPAKAEAEKFKVDYWHGGVIEQKLRAWGKWQPIKSRRA